MNKKYMTMFLSALFVLSAASAFARQHDKDAKRAMGEWKAMNMYSVEDCSVTFPNVLGGNMDMYEKKVEHFMSSSSFWEKCIQPNLDKGQNVTISYTAYTEGESPNARETVRAVKSAKDFTEEFTDYVEDIQEYTGVYEKPEQFTMLQVPTSINTNKQLMKEVKKANKHFKAKSEMPKVTVNVKFAKAMMPENIGAVKVSGPMMMQKSMETMPMQKMMPAQAATK